MSTLGPRRGEKRDPENASVSSKSHLIDLRHHGPLWLVLSPSASACTSRLHADPNGRGCCIGRDMETPEASRTGTYGGVFPQGVSKVSLATAGGSIVAPGSANRRTETRVRGKEGRGVCCIGSTVTGSSCMCCVRCGSCGGTPFIGTVFPMRVSDCRSCSIRASQNLLAPPVLPPANQSRKKTEFANCVRRPAIPA